MSRIRGRKLQEIRKRVLRDNPLCVVCRSQGRLTEATEVDHIVPLFKGGDESDENRQALCAACHQVKTRRDLGNKVNGCSEAGIPLDSAHHWH